MYEKEVSMVERRWRFKERFKLQMHRDIGKVSMFYGAALGLVNYACPNEVGICALLIGVFASVIWAGFYMIDL